MGEVSLELQQQVEQERHHQELDVNLELEYNNTKITLNGFIAKVKSLDWSFVYFGDELCKASYAMNKNLRSNDLTQNFMLHRLLHALK